MRLLFISENSFFVSGGSTTLLLFNVYWANVASWHLLSMDETTKVDACLVTTWHSTGRDEADACTDLIDSIESGATVSFCIDEYVTGRIVQKTFIGFSKVLELP